MTHNFPNFMKNINLYIQDTQYISTSSPRNIIIKLLTAEGKKWILKVARKKQLITPMSSSGRLTDDFFSETIEPEGNRMNKMTHSKFWKKKTVDQESYIQWSLSKKEKLRHSHINNNWKNPSLANLPYKKY